MVYYMFVMLRNEYRRWLGRSDVWPHSWECMVNIIPLLSSFFVPPNKFVLYLKDACYLCPSCALVIDCTLKFLFWLINHGDCLVFLGTPKPRVATT